MLELGGEVVDVGRQAVARDELEAQVVAIVVLLAEQQRVADVPHELGAVGEEVAQRLLGDRVVRVAAVEHEQPAVGTAQRSWRIAATRNS
jgi:hypothetical protein